MSVQPENTYEQLDELIASKNYDNALKLSKTACEAQDAWSTKPQSLIRLARLYLRLGNELPLKSDERRTFHMQALACVKKCEESEELKDDYMMHYLTAVINGKVAETLGPKKRIENAYVIRDHVMRAMELRPDEAGPRLVLGKWCMEVASIGTIARMAAKALFGAPPEATLDEALGHLKDAIERDNIDSPTYALVCLTMGQCLEMMKNAAEAKKWFEKCVASKAEQSADVRESMHEKMIRDDAAKALSKLK